MTFSRTTGQLFPIGEDWELNKEYFSSIWAVLPLSSLAYQPPGHHRLGEFLH